MCGRYTLIGHEGPLQKVFPFVKSLQRFEPRYNIAPTQNVPVIANDDAGSVRLFRWGLIPHFAKDPAIGNRMINARAETLAEKPSFRTAFARRRCLFLADGFYEWRKNPDGKTKTPMYIRMKSGLPFAFAGLWDVWRPQGGEPVRSVAIITTGPNTLLEPIHHRMPVIIRPEDYEIWLDPEERNPEDLKRLLVPFNPTEMSTHPVSKIVNNPRNDLPDCIEPE